MRRPVVVTGVSSGIGKAIAAKLIGDGYPVFGTVRRDEDAGAFQAAFGPLARALTFDLRDRPAIASAAEEVHTSTGGGGIAALINNAGVAIPGPLEHMPFDRFDEQIDASLKGTLAVSQAFLPMLKGARPGRIVNISSVAGATALPFLGAYAIAKHGVEAMSDSLRRELGIYGIDVVIVQPGGVRTPIWRKAASDTTGEDVGAYGTSLDTFRSLALNAGANGLDPDAIASLVGKILTARKPRHRYLISPHPVTERLMRIVPSRVLDRLIARRIGLRRH